MGEGGLAEFARDFHPQSGLQGMIIDVRANSGGFVSDMIIDRMERNPGRSCRRARAAGC
jgi:tricorn protease